MHDLQCSDLSDKTLTCEKYAAMMAVRNAMCCFVSFKCFVSTGLNSFTLKLGKGILWKCLLVSNLTVSSTSLIIAVKCLQCLH